MHILKIIPGLPTSYDPCRMIWLKDHIYSLAENNKVTVLILESLIHYFKPSCIKKWFRYGIPQFNVKHPEVNFVPVKYWGMPGYFLYKSFTAKRMTSAFERTIKRINLNEIDLIHAHFSSPAGSLARKLGREIHKPYIVTEHAGNFDFLYEKGFNVKEVIEDSAHLIYVSGKVKNAVLERINPLKVPYSIIPMGTDFSFFHIKEKRFSGTKKLLFIGWLVPNKGCDLLIKAVSLLLREGEDCELTIIGDGKEKENLRKLVNELGLNDKVEFMGNKSHEELKTFYQSCDVLISSSLKESFGVVIIEALACGKPVVATKSGGPETIINEKNGVLVSKDPSDMAKGIKTVFENYQSYHPYEIRKQAEERYSVRAVASKVQDVYKDLVK